MKNSSKKLLLIAYSLMMLSIIINLIISNLHFNFDEKSTLIDILTKPIYFFSALISGYAIYLASTKIYLDNKFNWMYTFNIIFGLPLVLFGLFQLELLMS